VANPYQVRQLALNYAIADELALRLTQLFRKDENGRRPVFGDNDKFQNDPHFRETILFHENFHGNNGHGNNWRGVGASQQTGWTGLVAKLIQARKHD